MNNLPADGDRRIEKALLSLEGLSLGDSFYVLFGNASVALLLSIQTSREKYKS
ncbi:MAG: hypothetical protein QNJ54_19920 [Prochloraceae cyanobacterium]|nr:hypothetical protein [Prochloraceae cyanobacterium]